MSLEDEVGDGVSTTGTPPVGEGCVDGGVLAGEADGSPSSFSGLFGGVDDMTLMLP